MQLSVRLRHCKQHHSPLPLHAPQPCCRHEWAVTGSYDPSKFMSEYKMSERSWKKEAQEVKEYQDSSVIRKLVWPDVRLERQHECSEPSTGRSIRAKHNVQSSRSPQVGSRELLKLYSYCACLQNCQTLTPGTAACARSGPATETRVGLYPDQPVRKVNMLCTVLSLACVARMIKQLVWFTLLHCTNMDLPTLRELEQMWIW
jgi:hypothetical protein